MSTEGISPAKIFISHSSKNKGIANILSELVTYSFSLNSEDVICTSADGHGLQNADDSYRQIKRSIDEAKLAIYLLSKEYCESEDCLYEAAWGSAKEEKFLIHLEGVKSKNKPKLFANLSMNELDEQGLVGLKKRLICNLSTSPDEAIWAKHQKKLLELHRNEAITPPGNKAKQGLNTDGVMLRLLRQACEFSNSALTEFWTFEQMYRALDINRSYLERAAKKAFDSHLIESPACNFFL